MRNSALLRSAAMPGGFLHRVTMDAEGAAAVAEVRSAIKDVSASLEKRDTEMKAAIDKAQAEIDATGKMSNEAKLALEKMSASGVEMQSRLTVLEQQLVNLRAVNDNTKIMTPGMKFLADPQVKAFVAAREKDGGMKPPGGRLRVVTNTITSLTSGDGGAGDLIVPQRVPGIIAQPTRTLRVRDLLPVGRTTSNAIEFIKETGFTNAAAPVAEGAAKPYSSLQFDVDSVPVRTIAHLMKATVQVLADVPQLQAYIDGRLRVGLQLVEEDELLSGDGTGQHLEGLIPQATAFDTARLQPGDTRIDVIRRAMTQLRIAEYRASAIVMNPVDWEEIELTKDTSGSYIWANPSGLLAPTLWGLPVVDSTALEEGEFLIGAFNIAAMLWDRQDATVEVSTENVDDFEKNLVTLRAEERIALTVFRPDSFLYGDFDTIVSS